MGGPRRLKIDRSADRFVGKDSQMRREIYATPDTDRSADRFVGKVAQMC